jgi:tetratricopeptide (TPR) repeat protein
VPSERVQRQIDRLLDEVEAAVHELNWTVVRDRARAVLAFDPDNVDAKAFLEAAEKGLGASPADARAGGAGPSSMAESAKMSPPHPTSFAAGRYTVKRFLGEGGKKKVYLAHDSLLDRDVAFALIKTDGLNDASRTRVTREAQAMGRLGNHPHIVTVFDLGVEPPSPSQGEGRDGGQPYMVLELMGGGDVEGLIEKAEGHKLPLEQAIRIAVETCRGLEFAHGHAIIHRDLKPGNVWLTQPGVAKIGDFGLAVATDRSRLTREGMMVGTVAYMPPEQATGGDVTARSDLYSLGCMLYEMVTGRPPFVGDNSVAIIGQHLNTPPIVPSWHRPDLPPALEALILRLLEKDPSKRPASAAVVRQALEGVDLTEPVGAGFKPAPTDQPMENPIYRRTFVGREPELKQLQGAWDGAVSGHGSLQMIVGEPGIGKTTLWEQLATYVSLRNGRALIGHCYEEGSLSLPYLPFVEAMRSYVVAREPEALKQELGSGAEPVARIVSEIRDRIPIEFHPPGDPEEERYRLLQAVSTFLRNAAAIQPILLVLEDLHDADRGTLDLLVHLARNLQGARLLVVGTYRDVEVDRSHPLSAILAELRRVSTFARVLLRGLTVNEVHRMLSELATQEVRRELAEGVFRQTEGNPLFVQEVMRYIAEEGLMNRQGGRWVGRFRETGEPPPEMVIPEGLRDVIGKRLSRLSPEGNRALSIAAVMGRDFRLDVLQRVADLPEEALFNALEEARSVGVVEERSAVGTGVAFRFTHALFRQTLYEEMFTPRRIRMHQQVAQALEQVYARRLEEHASELAEHFTQSTEPEALQKALQYGEMAAQRALGVFAYGEAVHHLERCLQVQEVLDPDDKARRCDLLLALGEALVSAGEPQRVFEAVGNEAFTLAEALRDRGRASRACQVARRAMRDYGSATITIAPVFEGWAQRADRYAEPGSADRVHADLFLGVVRYSVGRYAESQALRAGALELARRLDEPEALFEAARTMFAGVWTTPRRAGEQLRLAEEFAGRSREGVPARVLAALLFFLHGLLMMHGQPARAGAVAGELKALALRTREPAAQLQEAITVMQAALWEGQLEEALEQSRRFVQRADELGSPVWGRQIAAMMMRPLVHLGRAEEALGLQGQAEEMAGLREEGLFVSSRRAWVLAHLDRLEEARAALRLALGPLANPGDAEEAPMGLLIFSLEAALLLGDREAVALLAPLVAPAASLSTSGIGTPARHLGAAAVLLGQPDEARAYYQQALEAAGKIRFRPEIALTRLQLAELLLDEASVGAIHELPLQRRREAMAHLDFAIAEFRAMKMQPSLERALRHREILRA